MVKQLEKEIAESFPDGLTWEKALPAFHPESPEETADIFRLAAKYGQKLFISGFGNTVDPSGGHFAGILLVKSDRLNAVYELSAPDHFITIGAGYPLIEINRILASYDLWFPFADTYYPGSCGGAVAVGLTGFADHHPFPLGRQLLSLTAVLPDGSIVTPGANTFKSVSGYDLSRLFVNSWGSLGMIISLSFRVLPLSTRPSFPNIFAQPSNERDFIRGVASDDPLGRICRKIRVEYDPEGLLLPVDFPLP